MNGDRRQQSNSDRLVLFALAVAGALALAIQIALTFIAGALLQDVKRIDTEHRHLMEKTTDTLRICKQRQD